jgi:hypothetical protein
VADTFICMEVHRTVTGFFHEAVTEALRAQQVETSEPTEFYLVNLLADFTKASQVDSEPLALKMAQSKAQSRDERARSLKEIGDTTLYVAGFFSDSLTRKLVDVDYYMAMGESAYSQLAGLVGAARGSAAATQLFQEVYDELAGKFPRFVDVLQEVRTRTNFAGSGNLVRMCEEWVKTGSEWLERRLRATGVVALDRAGTSPDGKKIVH